MAKNWGGVAYALSGQPAPYTGIFYGGWDGQDEFIGQNSPGDGFYMANQVNVYTPDRNGRMGTTMTPVWKRLTPTPAAPAPAPTPAPGSNLPAPNDGQFGNITTNLAAQATQGSEEAARWQAQTAALNQQLADLRIANEGAMANLRGESAAQISNLNTLMLQQQQSFQSQQQLAAQQLAASQSAYEEQRRQTEAVSRAFVPNLQPTAAAPAVGDSRTSTAPATAMSNSNTLSSLSILSGLGGSSAPTSPLIAGLQIA
jgi:hypothetical protein